MSQMRRTPTPRSTSTFWASFWLSSLAALLAGCASPYAGVSIPVGPVSIGVGASNSGVSVGVGAGAGPVGVGVGVNQNGQVTGSAGVGVSTGIGNSNASIGAGVGTSTVLYDPHASPPPNTGDNHPTAATPSRQHPTSRPPAANNNAAQWRDAAGNPVPECKIRGRC